ncbi:MAG: YqjD family protein [Limisphaerales bacterium]
MEATEHGDTEKRELRAKLEAATEKAKEVCKCLQEQTVAAAKATDRAVREHPYQAVGIAFAVGLLIGVLVARSRRE